GGAKLVHVVAGRFGEDFASQTLPGFFLGATLGRRVRLRPELHVYIDEEEGKRKPFPLAGLAVEWEVRRRK
ncbi:MAG TPA: hypothetical protein VNL98_04925, partial [Gemmatimonadales bacterium]|nr:hypothetical protein [Gemmatimonadales bacterium]